MHRATVARTLPKTTVLVNNYSLYLAVRRVPATARFAIATFWAPETGALRDPLRWRYQCWFRLAEPLAMLSLLKPAEIDDQGGDVACADADDEDVGIDPHVLMAGRRRRQLGDQAGRRRVGLQAVGQR